MEGADAVLPSVVAALPPEEPALVADRVARRAAASAVAAGLDELRAEENDIPST